MSAGRGKLRPLLLWPGGGGRNITCLAGFSGCAHFGKLILSRKGCKYLKPGPAGPTAETHRPGEWEMQAGCKERPQTSTALLRSRAFSVILMSSIFQHTERPSTQRIDMTNYGSLFSTKFSSQSFSPNLPFNDTAINRRLHALL